MGELRKFIFRHCDLEEAGCSISMGDVFETAEGKFSVVKVEDWERAQLVAVYGKKGVR